MKPNIEIYLIIYSRTICYYLIYILSEITCTAVINVVNVLFSTLFKKKKHKCCSKLNSFIFLVIDNCKYEMISNPIPTIHS